MWHFDAGSGAVHPINIACRSTGHQSARTERRRLRSAGFTQIELIATSERGRPILHCRKASSEYGRSR
jgi:hypothetical protein